MCPYYFTYPVTPQPVDWCCHAQQSLLPLRYCCYFPLSTVSFNLLIKLGDLLRYVITIPLVSREKFEVITFIALTIYLEHEEFLYIDTRINIILDNAELCHCKSTRAGSCVCTHIHAVMSWDSQETWVVKLLEQRGNVAKSVRRGYWS